MLDARVYRAAFLPAFVMLFVAAFSLENRSAPAGTDLAPEAFSGQRAFGSGAAEPPPNSLLELAGAFPRREPGSAGDRALADRVAAELAEEGRFSVRRTRHEADVGAEKVTLETVVGVRPGVSSRRIAVLAHRDAARPGAAAELSGTAALLELARIADLRDLQRTLVMVSTSGATAGSAGARAWAQALGDPHSVDAVLVLGDLASRRAEPPWIVPWSNDSRPAPVSLQRTVEAAVRAETGADPGGSRALVQWVRRALPLAPGEQGELLAEGLPAVALQVSGEGGPPAGAAVGAQRMDAMGRAALRTITALDEAPVPRAGTGAESAPPPAGTDGVIVLRKVLPTWAVRLVVLSLLLPAGLLSLHAAVRLRARGVPVLRWIAWAAAGAVPVLAAWAWLRLLDLIGLLDAPRGAAIARDIPLGAGGVAAMASALVAGVLAARLLAPLAARATGVHGDPTGTAATTGIGALACLLCAGLAFTNPYAATLLLPAAHLWSMTPPARHRRAMLALAAAGGALLPLAALLVYAAQLDLAPADIAWTLTLAVSGGAFELGTAVALALFAGALGRYALVLAGFPRGGRPALPGPARGATPLPQPATRSLDGAGTALGT